MCTTKSLTLAVVLFFIFTTAHGQSPEYRVGNLLIEDPWSRALPPVSKNGAAFMNIHNRGGTADRLVSASSDIAEMVEIHSHEHVNGMMQMRKIDGVDLPAGGSATFQAGGLHIMFLGLRESLDDGKTFPMTLNFEHGGSLDIMVMVRKN